MTYDEALEYIHSARRFSSRASLDRIGELTRRLGNPQDRLRFIHLAGTNGKGSTAAILDSILRAAGFRAGLFTSPYLEDFRERIRLDGEMIPAETLAELTAELRQTVIGAVASGMEPPNEFELVTALALMYYSRADCPLAVWETGLGGRMDATNVIGPPLVAVITPISLDHVRELGNTPAEIALEKCGIIKPGTGAVISARQQTEVQVVIESTCQNAGLELLRPVAISSPMLSVHGSSFKYGGMELRLPLSGAHQLENAAVALGAVESLRVQGYDIPNEAIMRGLATVSWPGRLELVSERVLLDSAHNRGGTDVLLAALDSLFAGRELTVIAGMLADKEYKYCISRIAQRARRFIGVSPGGPRALEAEAAALVASVHCDSVFAAESLSSALDIAYSGLKSEEILLICGSIHLVGAARALLRQNKT